MVRRKLLRTSCTPMTTGEPISDLDVIGITRIARISIRFDNGRRFRCAFGLFSTDSSSNPQ